MISFIQETYDKNDGPDVKRVVYVKINASRRCLFEYAEHLQIKKLLKIDPMKIFRDEYKEDRTWSEWKIFSGLHRWEIERGRKGEREEEDRTWSEWKIFSGLDRCDLVVETALIWIVWTVSAVKSFTKMRCGTSYETIESVQGSRNEKRTAS